jgi:hypothetical protein
LNQLLFQRDTTSTTLFIALPPLNLRNCVSLGRMRSMTKRLFARRRRSTPSKGNPDISPDSTYCFCITLLNQQWPTDTMRTLTLSLPLLNPFDSMCDSRQDEDGVNCVPTRPLNQKSKNTRKREKQQAKKQAAQQRSKPAHDPRFMDTSNKIHTHTRRRLCSGRCAHGG